MAASSPAPSNNSTDTATTPNTSSIATSTPTSITTLKTNSPSKSALTPLRDAPKSLRGLNKPKCSQCGNVARSRCPFLSCKSCCAKAQNPCHIHVLKQNGTLPDKTPSSTSSLFDQKATDGSPPGTSLRVSSLRQLSQFNGTQVPFRARRPMTKKDAVALNQWRFSKLNEYRERNIEAENEAFDRYMQNVSLLEEAFLVNCPLENEVSAADATSTEKEENNRRMILGVKAELRSNPRRGDNFRKRIQGIVGQGLRKLQKWDLEDEETSDANDLDGGLKEVKRMKKTKTLRAERASAIDELVDKLNKARNEEELQSCLDMKAELFNQHEEAGPTESKLVEKSKEQVSDDGPTPVHESKYLPPRLWRTVKIDEETLHTIDKHFSSLDQIEDL